MSSNTRALLVVALLGLSAACTNDYDEFDFRGAGGSAVLRDASGAADVSAGAAGSGTAPHDDAASEPDEVGDVALPDGSVEPLDAADGSPSEGSADAGIGEGDSGPDVVETPDAPPDVASDIPDVSVNPEDASDEAESGPDAAEEASPLDAADETNPDASDSPPVIGCAPGSKACGSNCVSILDPATGCAAESCAPCVLVHATPACGNAGECVIDFCAAGFDDCDRLPETGCEASLADDARNCGVCGRKCSGAGTLSKQCSGGICASTCQIGFANCTKPFLGTDDGCERTVLHDDTNCGGCDNDCTMQGAANGFSCSPGTTPVNQCGCASDHVCRFGPAQGTCDSATGRCSCAGVACRPGEACRASASGDACSCGNGAACGAAQTCCQTPAGCRSLQTDPSSCGACGRACPFGFFCSAGECACTASAQCNAGSPGTCSAGQCTCSGSATPCARGQRCQSDGTCG